MENRIPAAGGLPAVWQDERLDVGMPDLARKPGQAVIYEVPRLGQYSPVVFPILREQFALDLLNVWKGLGDQLDLDAIAAATILRMVPGRRQGSGNSLQVEVELPNQRELDQSVDREPKRHQQERRLPIIPISRRVRRGLHGGSFRRM